MFDYKHSSKYLLLTWERNYFWFGTTQGWVYDDNFNFVANYSFKCHAFVHWCFKLMFYQLLELSFWRHPFTTKDSLVSMWCNAAFHQICSDEEINSCTSWMAWGWVNFQQIYILGWTITLQLFNNKLPFQSSAYVGSGQQGSSLGLGPQPKCSQLDGFHWQIYLCGSHNRDTQLTEIYDVYFHRMCAWRQWGDELFVFNCVRVQTTDLHTSVAMITHQAVQQQSALGEFWFFLRRQHSQKE